MISLIMFQLTYLSLMALLGISYGVQLANIITVSQELVGSGDMTLVYGMELFMQGTGGLAGGTISG